MAPAGASANDPMATAFQNLLLGMFGQIQQAAAAAGLDLNQPRVGANVNAGGTAMTASAGTVAGGNNASTGGTATTATATGGAAAAGTGTGNATGAARTGGNAAVASLSILPPGTNPAQGASGGTATSGAMTTTGGQGAAGTAGANTNGGQPAANQTAPGETAAQEGTLAHVAGVFGDKMDKANVLAALKAANKMHDAAYGPRTNQVKHQTLACAFISQRAEDTTLRLVHSVGEYWAPLGVKEAASGKLYAFVGDRTRGGNPPMISFDGNWLGRKNVRFGTPEAIDQFYAIDGNAQKLLAYNATLPETAVPQLPMIPLAWVGYVLKKRPTAYQLGEFVKQEIAGWTQDEKDTADYLVDWCKGACYQCYQRPAVKKETSPVSIVPTLQDLKSEHMLDWEDKHLHRMLRGGGAVTERQRAAVAQVPAPIVVQVQQPEPTPMHELDAAFLRGTAAQKRNTETVVETGTKFNDRQMARLQGVCCLPPNMRHLVPKLWTQLQTAKDWEDARSILRKHFDDLPEEMLDIFFHKENVEDLRHLRLSHASVPDAAHCHKGITPLAVALLSVDSQLDIERADEVQKEATVRTQKDVETSRRRPPPCPTTYDGLMHLLAQYSIFVRELFTTHNTHGKEVRHIRQGLMNLYRRCKGRLAREDIAHIVWAITADACQFFSTVCDRQDIEDENFLVSGLATIRSQILANQQISVRDTPHSWLVAARQSGASMGGGTSGGTGTARTVTFDAGPGGAALEPETGRPGGSDDKKHTGTGLRKQGGGGAADNVYNSDMHPAIAKMMQGFHERRMTLSLNRLNRAAGVRGITYLPKMGKWKACYRWLLGICGKDGKCHFGHEHLAAKDVTDDFATKLVDRLHDGVSQLTEQHDMQHGASPPETKRRKGAEAGNAGSDATP